MDYTGRPAKRQKGGIAEIPDPLIVDEVQCQTLIAGSITGVTDMESIAYAVVADPLLPAVAVGFSDEIVYPVEAALTLSDQDRDVVLASSRDLRAVGTKETLRLATLLNAGTAQYEQDFSVTVTGAGSMFFGYLLKSQCLSDTADYYGSVVGQRGWFFELFPDGRNLLYSNGASVTILSGQPLALGDYTCTLSTVGPNDWEISLLTPSGLVAQSISLAGTRADARVQFVVGDRSNVLSTNAARVDTLAVATDTTDVPEVYQFDQDAAGSMELGGRGTTISGNGVCVQTPITATASIVTNEVTADACKAGVISVQGTPPQADALVLGHWDFIDTPGVVEVASDHVDFIPADGIRAISSKEYFIPNDLEIGGWVRFEYTVTGQVSAQRFPFFGVHFKNAATKYFGFGTGFGSTEYYHKLRGHASNSVIEKGVTANTPSSPGFAVPNDSRLATRVRRTSPSEWTITHYFADGIDPLTPIVYESTFGLESGSKFCHAFAGVLFTGETSAEFSVPTIEYDRWHPISNSYTIEQNAGNELECNDSTGINIFRCSPNSYEISKPLVTELGIAGNRGLFGYPCPVTSSFYAAHSGDVYTGADVGPFELQRGNDSFGNPFLPRVTPGNVFTMDLTGVLSTGGGDSDFVISVYVGAVLMCSSVGTVLAQNNVDRVWSLHATIIPKTTNLATGTVSCASTGLFTYHNKITDVKDTVEGFSIYDGGVDSVIPLTAPGSLKIEAQWSTGDIVDEIAMIGCKYTYSGFNT